MSTGRGREARAGKNLLRNREPLRGALAQARNSGERGLAGPRSGADAFQARNIDILEALPADQTRTCNITVLGMALESLGKSAAAFEGNRNRCSPLPVYTAAKS